MATYKTGKGRGTKTVEARQFYNAHDVNVAYWAGGVLMSERNGANTIRIYPKGTDPLPPVVVNRYDWIVKREDGTLYIETPESFRDNYREVKEEK